MESQGKFLLSGTALVIWICTSWRDFELIWKHQQMTRLLLLRRWCDALKEFNSLKLFLLIVSGTKLYRKKARQRWKVAPAAFTFLSDWHFTKKGAPPSIRSILRSHWLFLVPFLGPLYFPRDYNGVKKQTTKGKSIENCYKFPQKVREQKKDKVNFLIGQRNKGSIKFCTICANIRQNKPFLRLPKNFQM